MSASLVSSMVVSLFLIFTILGFVFGWFRGLNKSLIRFIMVLAVGVLAFFVVPEITKAVLEMDISKFNLVIGNVQVMTIQDLVTDLLRQIPIVEDIIEASPTFESVIEIMPRAILNVALFVLLFFIFKWVSMIVYWIIAGVFFSKKKTAGKDKHNFVGAVIGAVQGFVIMFVLMVPFYGVINMLKPIANALNEEQSSVQMEQTFIPATKVSESGEAGKKNNAVTKTAEAITVYCEGFENVWVNKVLGFVGVNKLGVRMFDELTTVESKGTEFSLVKEVNIISEAYPHINPIINDGLNIQDNQQVNGLKKAIDKLYTSSTLSGMVKEIVPEMANRWVNGLKFCEINKPKVDEELQPLFDTLLLNLAVAQGDTIKNDIDTTLDVIIIANDAQLIKTLAENGDIMDVFSAEGNENLVSNIIAKALESSTLKAILPDVVNVGMNFVYEGLNIDKTQIGDIEVDSDDVNWTEESSKLQAIFSGVIKIYNQIQEGTEAGGSAIEHLDFKLLGETFDNIRMSELLGPSSLNIMEALLNSEEIVGDNKDTLAPFITELKTVWADTTKSLTPIFEAIGKAITLAKDLQSGAENFNAENLGDILSSLTDIAQDEALKGVVEGVVNTDTLQGLGLDKETADVVTETISSIIGADYSEESGNNLDKEIDAAIKIYDVANKVINNDSSDPESKVEISADDCEEIVNTLADSTILLDTIAQSGSGVENLNISENLSTETQEEIKDKIDSLTTETLEGKTQEEIEAIKNKLNSLFGF